MGWVTDWLGLGLRWFHFMIGVAWIGASFYFVWLNNTVRPPEEGEETAPGVAGGLWAIHGVAFYQVQKYGGAPARLPKTLHWFKWEAYLTWVTGFSLLILHFWTTAASSMV
ncbi:MAG TPA: urate hydroxylase PuuD, partial [Myxococcota bacterium]|nr:urate hydroxylase PuuD [Myxococcota bacterium]